ncbi:MAG: hypothetical protein K1X29_08910 [Bdellovibrionales bacterium]|nr:hypothetical protein [Bdellovibrionales bacterium]
MRTLKPWVQALYIEPSTFHKWALEAPKQESITFWCLDRGLIRSHDYFSWAMDFFGLPMLRSEYFAQAYNFSFWQQIKSVANWSVAMIPLSQWDGVVFIATVEPPEESHWSFPVQYVLATSGDLKKLWQLLNSQDQNQNQNQNQDQNQNQVSVSMGRESVLERPVVVSQPPPVISSEVTIKLPPPVTMTQSRVNSNTVNEPDSIESVTSMAEAPFTLNIPSLNKNNPIRASEPIKKSESPNPPTPQPPGDSVEFKLSVPSQLKKTPSPEGLSTLVESPVPAPVNVNSSLNVSVNEPSVVSGDGPIDSDRLAPSSFELAKNENEVIAWCFQQLKLYFRYSWYLFKKENTLLPYKWEISAQLATTISPVDLENPSLFRIVARTKMPYHGHVVESPSNVQFFKQWGLNTIPPHVTAVPLLVDQHLVGLLVCAGEKPANMDQVLKFVEKISSKILAKNGQNAFTPSKSTSSRAA